MGASQLPQHISQQFDRELEDIRSRVLAMGGLVEDQLALALDALTHTDADLAENVATSDYKVNSMEVGIDEECTEILARRQPAAGDLRLVLAVIKIIADLERIGDETAKIGRLVLRLIETESPKSHYVNVLSMGHHVKHTLNGALDSFARMDSKAALSFAREDPIVDREYDATLRQLITYMMEDPRSITAVLNVIWAVRALERIGDHANNICESVIYLVEGKDIRHTNYDDVEKELEELRRNP
jgi:phosphate transport system protein